MKNSSNSFGVYIIRGIFILLAVTWACVIFILSSRDADTSTEDSHGIGYMIGSIIYSDFEEWTESEQIEFEEKIDHLVRKVAHATEYAIFGFLLACALFSARNTFSANNSGDVISSDNGSYAKRNKNIKIRYLRNISVSFAVGTLYAASDEFHQSFVPGRSMQFSDILLDSFGVLIGTLFCVLVFSKILMKLLGRH